MEDVKISSEELEEIKENKETNSLENYSVQEESTQSLICNCLRYTGLAGRTYNYRGQGSGCVRVVFSRNGRVTSISGNIYVVNGRNYTVTVRPGEQHGFQCC